jgi:hypothetical protein
MARRTSSNRSNSNAASTEAAPTPTESTQEDTVSTNTEASPEATTESTDKPVDLTAFKSAVSTAVEGADQSTGEIAPAVLEPVVKEYRAIEGIKGKNQAKAYLADEMRKAMGAAGESTPDIVKARSFLQLQDSMTAGSSGGAPKAPADPTEAFVQADATLRLAVALHTPGEGVAEDYESKVESLVAESEPKANEYLAWLNSPEGERGDEPEVSAVVKNAVKLAQGKSAKAGGRSNGGSTFTGERRDIGKHIASAFADVESGTFLTVAEIKKHKSEEYGDSSPSAGAISARLFPKSGNCTVEGITPTQENGKNGATKD